MRSLIALSLLLALWASAPAFGQQASKYDYDKEIKRKQRELKRVLKEQKKVQKASRKDKAEFDAYKARTKRRMDTLRGQTGKIQSSIAEWRKKQDALGAKIGRQKRTTKNFGYRQTVFKKRLIKHCDALLETARKLPPLLSAKAVAALDYLKSELTAGSADNIEGLHRLVRIARRMDAQLMEIQVVQGSSPIPQITGTCHRLRVGGVFEAVAKGDTAAVWDFDAKKWKTVSAKQARMIMNAVEVRNGKKMPALVRIPLPETRSPSPQSQPVAPPPAKGKKK